eukprot:jgi/Bigna1/78681/fgenesh1_pg.56_\
MTQFAAPPLDLDVLLEGGGGEEDGASKQVATAASEGKSSADGWGGGFDLDDLLNEDGAGNDTEDQPKTPHQQSDKNSTSSEENEPVNVLLPPPKEEKRREREAAANDWVASAQTMELIMNTLKPIFRLEDAEDEFKGEEQGERRNGDEAANGHAAERGGGAGPVLMISGSEQNNYDDAAIMHARHVLPITLKSTIAHQFIIILVGTSSSVPSSSSSSSTTTTSGGVVERLHALHRACNQLHILIYRMNIDYGTSLKRFITLSPYLRLCLALQQQQSSQDTEAFLDRLERVLGVLFETPAAAFSALKKYLVHLFVIGEILCVYNTGDRFQADLHLEPTERILTFLMRQQQQQQQDGGPMKALDGKDSKDNSLLLLTTLHSHIRATRILHDYGVDNKSPSSFVRVYDDGDVIMRLVRREEEEEEETDGEKGNSRAEEGEREGKNMEEKKKTQSTNDTNETSHADSEEKTTSTYRSNKNSGTSAINGSSSSSSSRLLEGRSVIKEVARRAIRVINGKGGKQKGRTTTTTTTSSSSTSSSNWVGGGKEAACKKLRLDMKELQKSVFRSVSSRFVTIHYIRSLLLAGQFSIAEDALRSLVSTEGGGDLNNVKGSRQRQQPGEGMEEQQEDRVDKEVATRVVLAAARELFDGSGSVYDTSFNWAIQCLSLLPLDEILAVQKDGDAKGGGGGGGGGEETSSAQKEQGSSRRSALGLPWSLRSSLTSITTSTLRKLRKAYTKRRVGIGGAGGAMLLGDRSSASAALLALEDADGGADGGSNLQLEVQMEKWLAEAVQRLSQLDNTVVPLQVRQSVAGDRLKPIKQALHFKGIYRKRDELEIIARLLGALSFGEQCKVSLAIAEAAFRSGDVAVAQEGVLRLLAKKRYKPAWRLCLLLCESRGDGPAAEKDGGKERSIFSSSFSSSPSSSSSPPSSGAIKQRKALEALGRSNTTVRLANALFSRVGTLVAAAPVGGNVLTAAAAAVATGGRHVRGTGGRNNSSSSSSSSSVFGARTWEVLMGHCLWGCNENELHAVLRRWRITAEAAAQHSSKVAAAAAGEGGGGGGGNDVKPRAMGPPQKEAKERKQREDDAVVEDDEDKANESNAKSATAKEMKDTNTESATAKEMKDTGDSSSMQQQQQQPFKAYDLISLSSAIFNKKQPSQETPSLSSSSSPSLSVPVHATTNTIVSTHNHIKRLNDLEVCATALQTVAAAAGGGGGENIHRSSSSIISSRIYSISVGLAYLSALEDPLALHKMIQEEQQQQQQQQRDQSSGRTTTPTRTRNSFELNSSSYELALRFYASLFVMQHHSTTAREHGDGGAEFERRERKLATVCVSGGTEKSQQSSSPLEELLRTDVESEDILRLLDLVGDVGAADELQRSNGGSKGGSDRNQNSGGESDDGKDLLRLAKQYVASFRASSDTEKSQKLLPSLDVQRLEHDRSYRMEALLPLCHGDLETALSLSRKHAARGDESADWLLTAEHILHQIISSRDSDESEEEAGKEDGAHAAGDSGSGRIEEKTEEKKQQTNVPRSDLVASVRAGYPALWLHPEKCFEYLSQEGIKRVDGRELSKLAVLFGILADLASKAGSDDVKEAMDLHVQVVEGLVDASIPANYTDLIQKGRRCHDELRRIVRPHNVFLLARFATRIESLTLAPPSILPTISPAASSHGKSGGEEHVEAACGEEKEGGGSRALAPMTKSMVFDIFLRSELRSALVSAGCLSPSPPPESSNGSNAVLARASGESAVEIACKVVFEEHRFSLDRLAPSDAALFFADTSRWILAVVGKRGGGQGGNEVGAVLKAQGDDENGSSDEMDSVGMAVEWLKRGLKLLKSRALSSPPSLSAPKSPLLVAIRAPLKLYSTVASIEAVAGARPIASNRSLADFRVALRGGARMMLQQLPGKVSDSLAQLRQHLLEVFVGLLKRRDSGEKEEGERGEQIAVSHADIDTLLSNVRSKLEGVERGEEEEEEEEEEEKKREMKQRQQQQQFMPEGKDQIKPGASAAAAAAVSFETTRFLSDAFDMILHQCERSAAEATAEGYFLGNVGDGDSHNNSDDVQRHGGLPLLLEALAGFFSEHYAPMSMEVRRRVDKTFAHFLGSVLVCDEQQQQQQQGEEEGDDMPLLKIRNRLYVALQMMKIVAIISSYDIIPLLASVLSPAARGKAVRAVSANLELLKGPERLWRRALSWEKERRTRGNLQEEGGENRKENKGRGRGEGISTNAAEKIVGKLVDFAVRSELWDGLIEQQRRQSLVATLGIDARNAKSIYNKMKRRSKKRAGGSESSSSGKICALEWGLLRSSLRKRALKELKEKTEREGSAVRRWVLGDQRRTSALMKCPDVLPHIVRVLKLAAAESPSSAAPDILRLILLQRKDEDVVLMVHSLLKSSHVMEGIDMFLSWLSVPELLRDPAYGLELLGAFAAKRLSYVEDMLEEWTQYQKKRTCTLFRAYRVKQKLSHSQKLYQDLLRQLRMVETSDSTGEIKSSGANDNDDDPLSAGSDVGRMHTEAREIDVDQLDDAGWANLDLDALID